MKLKPLSLGVSIGLVWGGALFITTWVSFYTGYGRLFLEAMAQSIYPGYTISISGSFLGFFYGSLDGFVCGAFIAWIYNRIS